MRARFPALGFDPAPGEPEQACACAREHRRAAVELDRLAAQVARLPASVATWRGAAATAFSAALAPLPGRLREAAQALAATGAHLSAWADELEDLQERARRAERAAADALERVREAVAGGRVVDAWDAEEDLRRAVQQADEVRAAWRAGGRRAASAVDAAAAAAPPLPGGLGELVWQHRHGISWAADISSMASFPVAFAGPVGAAAGAALGAAGLAGHALLAAYADGATSDVVLGASVLGMGGASAAVRPLAASPAGDVAVRAAERGLHYGEVALGAVSSGLTAQKRVRGPADPVVAPARPGAAHRLLVRPVVGEPSRRRR